MGYYTEFNLKVQNSNDIIDLVDHLKTFSDGAYHAMDMYGNTVGGLKWYEYLDDMIKFSKLYPDLIFEMYGNGEETGDIWVHYFKDGKSYRDSPEIVFPKYDETKLKDKNG